MSAIIFLWVVMSIWILSLGATLPIVLFFIALYAFLGFAAYKTIKGLDKECKEFKEFVDKEHEKERCAYEKWEKEHPHFEAEEFYLKLEEAGISEIDSEYKKEKMLLFIKNNDLKVSGTTEEIVEFFYLGKREVERLKNEELVNKHREEEKNSLRKAQNMLIFTELKKALLTIRK